MKGLPTCARSLADMPMPVSLTQKCRRDPIRFAPMTMLPPCGVNLIAFETRLISICWTARLSAWTSAVSGETSTLRSSPLAAA